MRDDRALDDRARGNAERAGAMARAPMSCPVNCPVCGKPAEAVYRPFCSRRCADVDLGRWFNEDYRIPAGPADEDGDGDAAGDGDGDAAGEEGENAGESAAENPRGALAH